MEQGVDVEIPAENGRIVNEEGVLNFDAVIKALGTEEGGSKGGFVEQEESSRLGTTVQARGEDEYTSSSPTSSSSLASSTSSVSSKPEYRRAKAAREYNEIEGQIVKLSISHDGDYAIAAALAPTLTTVAVGHAEGGHIVTRDEEENKALGALSVAARRQSKKKRSVLRSSQRRQESPLLNHDVIKGEETAAEANVDAAEQESKGQSFLTHEQAGNQGRPLIRYHMVNAARGSD